MGWGTFKTAQPLAFDEFNMIARQLLPTRLTAMKLNGIPSASASYMVLVIGRSISLSDENVSL